MNLLRVLQTVDRRFLYALLILAVTLPFFVPMQLPVVVSPATEALYDTIEELPEGSFVLVGIDWGAGTRGESSLQTVAIIRHLMRKHLHFAMIGFSDPQGATLGQEIVTSLQDKYGFKEGRDWANFGFQVDMTNYLKSFVLNIGGQIKADVHGTPLAKLPVMHGIRTAKDIRMLIDVTGTTSYLTYIQFMQGPYSSNLKMGVSLTSVMAPEAFNYFDSKQLAGLVPGLEGAAEYEARYAKQYEPNLALGSRVTQYSNSSAFAHLLIIFFIILGNIAMILERRLLRRPVQRG